LTSPSRDKIINFENWLREEGAQFDKLKISYVTEINRIIKASADIKKGEVCLFVPKKVLISQ
jgi:hypothetical protein